MFVIETPSAYRPMVNCLLGEGATEAEAWADAYGPKPWSPSTRKAARSAWARSVEQMELELLREEAAN